MHANHCETEALHILTLCPFRAHRNLRTVSASLNTVLLTPNIITNYDCNVTVLKSLILFPFSWTTKAAELIRLPNFALPTNCDCNPLNLNLSLFHLFLPPTRNLQFYLLYNKQALILFIGYFSKVRPACIHSSTIAGMCRTEYLSPCPTLGFPTRS